MTVMHPVGLILHAVGLCKVQVSGIGHPLQHFLVGFVVDEPVKYFFPDLVKILEPFRVERFCQSAGMIFLDDAVCYGGHVAGFFELFEERFQIDGRIGIAVRIPDQDSITADAIKLQNFCYLALFVQNSF